MNVPMQLKSFCYDNPAKLAHSQAVKRFYNAADKLLNHGEHVYVIKKHFNPGGIAVWGETYAKIYARDPLTDYTFVTPSKPVVEAYDTSMGMLVRQWDGSHSGANHYAQTLEQFVMLVRELASKPFVRF